MALSPLEEAELKSLKLDGGSVIRQIYGNTPAAQAGLEAQGDAISHLNGTPIKDTDLTHQSGGTKESG